MAEFSFTIAHNDAKTQARTGVIHTPHGDIQTPAFIPVGTQATVKSLIPEEIKTVGTQMFFVNTYHMAMRPGIDIIEHFGGLHAFMQWDLPLITDSGGFQVFSLARGKQSDLPQDEANPSLVKITEAGVAFRSHWDGSHHLFTPEVSMQFQWKLGSDIHIAFDDCTPSGVTKAQAERSMERTHRWLLRSVNEHKQLSEKTQGPYQALYGSVQGSIFEDLRVASAQYVTSLATDGIAIGGVSVGESKQEMRDVVSWTMPHLPIDKPKHLLGVGDIDDIFMLVSHGIDTFDCVNPTRIARMGYIYTHERVGEGRQTHVFDISKSIHEKSEKPLDAACCCFTCQTYTRGYIHHLFKVKELLGYRLVTLHNLFFIHQLVEDIRQAIAKDQFLELARSWSYNT